MILLRNNFFTKTHFLSLKDVVVEYGEFLGSRKVKVKWF